MAKFRAKPHPSNPYANRIRLIQFRCGDPSDATYDAQFRIKPTDRWSGRQRLTEATDWTEACFASVERLHAIEAGTAPRRSKRETNTVAEIADITIARLTAERAREIERTGLVGKGHKFAAKISRIKTTILPGLADRGIANLIPDDLTRFTSRLKVGEDAPKRGSIGNINSAWLEILRDAFDAGWITGEQIKKLTISQSGFDKGEKGAGFSVAEMHCIRA